MRKKAFSNSRLMLTTVGITTLVYTLLLSTVMIYVKVAPSMNMLKFCYLRNGDDCESKRKFNWGSIAIKFFQVVVFSLLGKKYVYNNIT